MSKQWFRGHSLTRRRSFLRPRFELLEPRWTLTGVVINEIHYDPNLKTEAVEFIELLNTNGTEIDLSGWRLTSAVHYEFPEGTRLGAGQFLVIAQNSLAFSRKFGLTPAGQWADGDQLDNQGETVLLLDQTGAEEDRVDYGRGFPWPTVGDVGRSIELVNPSFDNSVGGNWRAAGAVDTQPVIYLAAGNDQWRYRPGTSEASNPIAAWREPAFVEDAAWQTAQTPLGFGDDDDATVLVDMRGSYSSLYLRNNFQMPRELPEALQLRVYVDDGAIVWINGAEVGRFFVSDGEKAFDGLARSHEAAWIEATLNNAAQFLVPGENTIAVHALNASLGGDDFSIDVELRTPPADVKAGAPTPGRANSVLAENIGPQLRKLNHSPEEPHSNEEVTITVLAGDAVGQRVEKVQLAYQVVDPGHYIRTTDGAYVSQWQTVAMSDDGRDGDLQAADGIYTVVLPASLQQHRRLIRYRLTATDDQGAQITVPYADDPQPNFAYFVYDGVPDWTGADRPGVTPTVTFGSDVMQQFDVYHLIADGRDILNSQYNGTFEETHFLGTIVFAGKVYDNIEFQVRGEFSTYQSGKNKWRVFFNRGHEFQAYDNYGRPYAKPWSAVNFSAMASPWVPINRGMAGLDEGLAMRTYDLSGIPTMNTNYFQLRVIDGEVEANPNNQYDGDLWGLYMTIEQPNDDFVDNHGIPDGNIYKMEGGAGDKKNQGPTDSPTNADINAFVRNYMRSQTLSWWRENVDLDALFTFKALNRALGNVDLREGWNHLWYHNSATDQWVPIPWDLDMMYPKVEHWSGTIDAVENAVAQHAILKLELQARARELRDLLFNGEFDLLVDEQVSIVDPADQPWTMADVDQFMWNYNSRSQNGHRGAYYASPNSASLRGGSYSRTLTTKDVAGFGQYIKAHVAPSGYGGRQLDRLHSDPQIPVTPEITYAGAANYDINELRFRTNPFADPQGEATFGAMEWRIAEILHPGVPHYVPGEPQRYEIDATWESGILADYTAEITIPPTALQGNRTYRARVRTQDETGRWSHWSQPIEFTTAVRTDLVDSLRISEVHYHPAEPSAAERAAGWTDADEFEFIELINGGNSPLAIQDVALVDVEAAGGPEGVTFHFDESPIQILAPRARILVVENQAAFVQRYGDDWPIAGEWIGKLKNSGETLTLVAGPLTLLQFTYDDDWYKATDGQGFSLEAVDPHLPAGAAWSDAAQWMPSATLHGTPGQSRVAGDFDSDQLATGADIDLIFAALASQSPEQPFEAAFDLVRDGMLNMLDVEHLITVILQTTFGDANLDRRVDFEDFVILATNFGAIGPRQHPEWDLGNFDGDDSVGFSDFVLLAQNFGFPG